MTVYSVMKDLKGYLEEVVKSAQLSTKNNIGRIPKIILGYLDPLEDEEEKEDFPYIILRYIEDGIEEEESTLKLKLIFGVHSLDTYGWVDVLHLMELVKLGLLKKQMFSFYSVMKKIKSSMPEEQPYPYFFGFMELPLNIPQQQMEGEMQTWQLE